MLDLCDKKILVTGGAGFLGSRVVERLVAHGVPREHIAIPSVAEADLRQREACDRVVLGVDIVVHCAGTMGNAEFHHAHPADIFFDNLTMGVELMDASRSASVKKFVTIGSGAEYSADAPLPFREDNLWLGYPEKVHAPYGVAKTMLLVQAQAYRAQYGFDAIHLLLANMYGPGVEADKGFVVSNIIRRMLAAKKNNEKVVEVWGTGTPTRDFLYVEDAAEGIVRAVEGYGKPEPVNLGSGWEISIRELAELIARLTGFTGKLRWDATKPDGQMRRMLDVSRAEREFGFRPSTSFEDGLRETIAWHERQRT